MTGSASELEDLEVQYPDFAIWQRGWADSGGLEEQMRYWRERLAGDPPRLALPSDRPRPEVETGHGGSVVVSLPVLVMIWFIQRHLTRGLTFGAVK